MKSIYAADWVIPITGEPIPDGAIVVSGKSIERVGKRASLTDDYPGARVHEFGESVLLPGLVNCHAHLELTGLRGALDKYDFDFLTWLKTITSLRQDLENDDSIRVSALLGAVEMAAGGVTTIGDIGRMSYAGAAALDESGLRGTVYQETGFYPDNKDAEQGFDVVREKYESTARLANDRISVGVSPHAPYTVSRRLFELISDYSVRNSIPLTIHAAESGHEEDLLKRDVGLFREKFYSEVGFQSPKMSTIEYFSDIGVLESKPLLAHCIRLTEKEVELIAKADATVAHCPVSNAKFGHGIAPVSGLLKAGVTVGLGSDSMASNNRCDLFEEGRISLLLRRSNGDSGAEPAEILEMMTLGGAKALRLEQQVGSLEAGKQADFTVIELNGLGQVPVHDIYSTLVYSTNASNVTATYVAGEVVYENGSSTKVDQNKLRSEVKGYYLK